MMPRGWEDNRRSGVALAMRHQLGGLSSPPTGFTATEREMCTCLGPGGARHTLPFTFKLLVIPRLQLHDEANRKQR